MNNEFCFEVKVGLWNDFIPKKKKTNEEQQLLIGLPYQIPLKNLLFKLKISFKKKNEKEIVKSKKSETIPKIYLPKI